MEMKQKFACLIIFVTCSLGATETRVNTMGGMPHFLVDNSNVRLYPSLIVNYSGEIIGEVKRPALSSFLSMGKAGVFGLGINSDSVPTIVNKAINKADFVRYSSAPPQFAVHYGKKIRKLGAVGAKVNGANNYYRDSESNCSQSITMWGGTVGFTFLPDEKATIDVFGNAQRFGFKSTKPWGAEEITTFRDQGNYSLNGGARLLSTLSSTKQLVLGVNYGKTDVSWLKEGPEEKSEILTSQTTEVYSAVNLSPSPATLAILGLVISETKSDTITTTDVREISTNCTIHALPKVIVATEAKLNDWFGVRIGASKCFQSRKSQYIEDSEAPEITEHASAPFDLSLGWSIWIRNFELDIMCNELPLVTSSVKLSATYKFSSSR
jgi:hypothetical protein